eukprot:7645502-Alexandrium_andersonii.AAC.1
MPYHFSAERLAEVFGRVPGMGQVRAWISRARAAYEAYLCFGSSEEAGRALVERANLAAQGCYLK